MARRSEHSQEEIKQMIVDAAESIIREDGLNALKVRTIAMEIGYTVGSIYMVFNSLAELILHLKGRALDDITLHLQHVSTNQSAQDCLLALAKAYLNFATEQFNRWQMLVDHSQTASIPIPEWYKTKVAQGFIPVEQQFKRLAPQASSEQTQRAAHALWGGVHGICYLSFMGSLEVVGAEGVEASVVLLTDNFVRGWMLDINLSRV